MDDDHEWWWAWCGGAGGAWAAVVCVVVVAGTAMNVAVLVHWVLSRAAIGPPSAALACVDLLMCAVAAPIRYAHAPPIHTPLASTLVAQHPHHNNTLHHHGGWEVFGGPRGGDTVAHVVVVWLCVASLHVVAVVAVHRVALLWLASQRLHALPTLRCAVVVAVGSLAWSGVVVAPLHATHRFTDKLPLLGVFSPRPPGAPPPPLVVGFLSYVAGLCGAVALCYGAIFAALLRQGRSKPLSTPPLVHTPTPVYANVSIIGQGSSPGVAPTLGRDGHGRAAVRACITVLSVLVTLVVCWAVPVGLALYALLTEASMTPWLPYSDALLLLSGMVHPFVYGEGWAAVMACASGARQGVSSVAFRTGLTCRRKARRRRTGPPAPGADDGEGGSWWPWRRNPRPSDTQVLTHTPIFFPPPPPTHAHTPMCHGSPPGPHTFRMPVYFGTPHGPGAVFRP